MGTKTISIMEDVYGLLVKNKKVEESFSQELRRILPKKKSIMEFAGAWKDMSKEEAERMKKTIRDYRRNSSKRTKERFFGK